MSVAKREYEDILDFIRDRPRSTTRQIADFVFGEATYQYCRQTEITNTLRKLTRLEDRGEVRRLKGAGRNLCWEAVE